MLPASTQQAAGHAASVPSNAEVRDGYQRTAFKHWVDADKDSCNTRAEFLIAESRVKPTNEASCKVTASEWFCDCRFVRGHGAPSVVFAMGVCVVAALPVVAMVVAALG